MPAPLGQTAKRVGQAVGGCAGASPRPGRPAAARPVTARSAGAGLGFWGKRRTPRGGAAPGLARRATAPQGRDSRPAAEADLARGGRSAAQAPVGRSPPVRRAGEPAGKREVS